MEDKQDLTEQQKILLSKLETLRAEMHRSVDARVDRSIQRILTGSVLEESPTLPLHTDPSVFKGKKPEAVLFPNGQSVRTPTWKAAVLAIMQDCNADPTMHTYLMELRGKVTRKQRCRSTPMIGRCPIAAAGIFMICTACIPMRTLQTRQSIPHPCPASRKPPAFR